MASQQLVCLALLAAVLSAVQLAACEEAATYGATKADRPKPGDWPLFLWPGQAREGKQNIFVMGMKPWLNQLPENVQAQIISQLESNTQDLSDQVSNYVPESTLQQWQDMMNQMGSLTPSSLMNFRARSSLGRA